MSDNTEIRLLKEAHTTPAPPPLSASTRRKFVLLLMSLAVTCSSCIYAIYLQYEIGQMRNPERQTIIQYATVTPASMAKRVIPTAVLLPTSTPPPDDAPTDSVGPITAFKNDLVLLVEKPDATELWRTVGTNSTLLKIADLGILDFSDFQFIPYGDQLLVSLLDTQTGQNRYWQVGPSYHTTRIDSLPPLAFHEYAPEVGDYEIFVRPITSDYARLIARDKKSRVVRELDVLVQSWSSNSTIVYHDSLLFAGGDDRYSYELWRTVGTSEGTFLVMNIRRGNTAGVGSNVIRSAFPADFTLFNDKVIFTATASHSAARNLWVTAGTEESTKMLTRFSFEKTGTPQSIAISQDGHAAVIPTEQHVFFFTNTDGSNAWDGQVWVSDGTVAGTNWIKDFLPAEGDTFAKLPPAVVVDNRLYLITSSVENDHTYELWVSYGTSTGTDLLFTFESDTPPSLVATAENVYFASNQNGQGHFYHYRPVSEKLRELSSTSSFEPIDQLVALNNKIYFANRTGGQASLVYFSDVMADNLLNFQFRYPRD